MLGAAPTCWLRTIEVAACRGTCAAAIDIYKLLPKTNSKKCGQPTCLPSRAARLGKARSTNAYRSEEAREKSRGRRRCRR